MVQPLKEEEVWIKSEPVDEGDFNPAENDPLTVERLVKSEPVNIKLECADFECAASINDATLDKLKGIAVPSYECTSPELTEPFRIHSDDEPLRGTTFPPHKARRIGERPYTCDPCKLHFVHKESLEQHMKKEQHHKAVAAAAAAVSVLCDRIFPCDDCDRKFTRVSDLQIHKQRHIDLKCDQCGKVFPRKHHLQRHKRVHSNEKPFVCDICGKRFKQNTHLTTHQKIHVDGPSDLHHCDKCDKKFRYRQGLKKHKQKH